MMNKSIAISGFHAECSLGDEFHKIIDALLDPVDISPEIHPTLAIPLFRMKNNRSADTLSIPANTRECALAHLCVCAKNAMIHAFGKEDFPSDGERTGCVVGTTGEAQFCRPDFYTALRSGTEPPQESVAALAEFTQGSLAEVLAERFRLNGPALTISNTCVSGTDAVGLGALWIQSGYCSRVLCCGVDLATLMPLSGFFTLGAASLHQCRPFDRDRDGMNVGEGAACVILEREDVFQKRSGLPEFRLRGYGAAGDAYHLTAPHPQGTGLEKAIQKALEGISPEQIDFVYAHGTGTVANDLCEASVLARVFGPQVHYFSTKALTGHTLGASGILRLIFAMGFFQKGIVPPSWGCSHPDDALPVFPLLTSSAVRLPFALISSLAFGGCNSALLLEHTEVSACN